MRRLLLLRHAKAERSQPGGRDHDRVLAERGRADAPKLGAYMVRHAFMPDLVVVSTSARTRETWDAGRRGLPRTVRRCSSRTASTRPRPQGILKVIKETDRDVGTLLVIGHNPGLQELAASLIAAGDVEARQRLKEDFPTSALAVIDFALEDWSRCTRAPAGWSISSRRGRWRPRPIRPRRAAAPRQTDGHTQAPG